MGLKVFDLQCANSHLFEGWFGSHDDYDAQQARGLVSCPMCQDTTITKRLSAPRLNVGHFSDVPPVTDTQATAVTSSSNAVAVSNESGQLLQLQAALMQQMREFVSKTENVGDRFADEARRIHEGESDDRPIRGTATPQEREALAEEGIAVVALPEFLDTDRLQ
jgi:hypothetical protein